MQEETLYNLWQHYARKGVTISWQNHTLKIHQAGILNLQQGPDFLSARYELDGVLYQGAVECHLDAQDWYGHGHHLDRAYADVLLHILYRPPSGPDVGHSVSRNRIINFVLPPVADDTSITICPAQAKNRDILVKQLSALGLQRFNEKLHLFKNRLECTAPQVLFYEYLMRSLGYPVNQDCFQQLALRLPLERVETLARHISAGFDLLFALYCGQAGLLHNQDVDTYNNKIYQLYLNYRVYLNVPPLAFSCWKFGGVRPLNHPQFRLAGLVALLLRSKGALFADLKYLLAERTPAEVAYRRVRDYFRIPCSSYWENHFAVGRTMKSYRNRFFFNTARVQEITVNLLLPLLAAEALIEGNEGFLNYLLDFYYWLPQHTRYNALLRRVPALKKALPEGGPTPAIHWQGAVHLQHAYCPFSLCDSCPIEGT